jgi:hypothetical protein
MPSKVSTIRTNRMAMTPRWRLAWRMDGVHAFDSIQQEISAFEVAQACS